jgi:steroid delta-isomerase-like uncharacterized protein
MGRGGLSAPLGPDPTSGAEPPMPPSDNKALVRRFVDEAQTRGNLAAIDECLSPEFVDHSAPPGLPAGREGVRALFAALRHAFPDLRAEIHDQVAEADRVVTRKTLRGTHRGEFLGIPATGRAVSFAVIDVLRVRDGQITDHWNVVDRLHLLEQLGALAAPAHAAGVPAGGPSPERASGDAPGPASRPGSVS